MAFNFLQSPCEENRKSNMASACLSVSVSYKCCFFTNEFQLIQVQIWVKMKN